MPPREDWEGEEFTAAFAEMRHVSDRVAAISSAAYLDNAIGLALITRFIPLGKTWRDQIFDGATAPLSTFSSKAKIGYVIGLYGPNTYKDIDIIRKIRNEFAHNIGPLSFSDTADKCSLLKAFDLKTRSMPIQKMGFEFGEQNGPKARYIVTAQYLSLQLIMRKTNPDSEWIDELA
jgi:hypothetical protein